MNEKRINYEQATDKKSCAGILKAEWRWMHVRKIKRSWMIPAAWA